MNWVFDPWKWYIAGPIIGLFVPALLIVANKMLGISSSFEHMCIALLPKDRKGMFNYNIIENGWKVMFVIGITIGAFIAANFLSSEPARFLTDHYYTTLGYFKLFIGGIFVGFGTRYANGCTSGHAIFGLSTLQSSSLRATISFFAGGLIYTYLASFF